RRGGPGPAVDRQGPDRAGEVRMGPAPRGGGGEAGGPRGRVVGATPRRPARRRWGVPALMLFLPACDRPFGLDKVVDADAVPRPEWRMGDRWVYRRVTADGGTTIVTYLVTAVTIEGYTVRLVGLAPDVSETWTRELHLRARRVAGRAPSEYE